MGYSPVYSQPFVQYTPDTPNTSFLVPDGYTAIVRQWSVVQNVGGYDFNVDIQDSEAAPSLRIVQIIDVGINASYQGEGRWVVPPGGLITVGLSDVGSSVSIYVGGYLLTNDID